MGKKRLDQALASLPQDEFDFDVQWKAYIEHPYVKEGDLASAAGFYQKRYKKASIWNALKGYLSEQGKQHAINFQFDAPICSTVSAHRLIAWARRFEKQHEVRSQMIVHWGRDD